MFTEIFHSSSEFASRCSSTMHSNFILGCFLKEKKAWTPEDKKTKNPDNGLIDKSLFFVTGNQDCVQAKK